MKANYTHIAMLLDRSGSMGDIKEFIIEGFNDFIKEQQKVSGDLTVSLVQFDDEYETLFDFENINKITFLTDKIYAPRGMTALNDSWVRLIEETGKKLSSMKEEDRPEKVLLVSLSDGLENKSIKYQGVEGDAYIKNLVEQQENIYNWKFLYIGANQDAKKEGTSRGVNNYMNFKATQAGVGAAFASFTTNAALYRNSKDAEFSVHVD